MRFFKPNFHAGQHVQVMLDKDLVATPATIWSVWPTLLEVIVESEDGTKIRIVEQERVLSVEPTEGGPRYARKS